MTDGNYLVTVENGKLRIWNIESYAPELKELFIKLNLEHDRLKQKFLEEGIKDVGN